MPFVAGPIYRSKIRRAFDAGALGNATTDDLNRLLKGISAHSTRLGLNQDLFTSGEDLVGITDALRWKSPRRPLPYYRYLAAKHEAAGRLMSNWNDCLRDFRYRENGSERFGVCIADLCIADLRFARLYLNG